MEFCKKHMKKSQSGERERDGVDRGYCGPVVFQGRDRFPEIPVTKRTRKG